MQVLAIDIGGTNVKLLRTGDSERRKFPSGPNLTPKRFAKAIKVRRLVGSSTGFGVGIKVGVCVAGPSVETWFLAYLLI